MKKSLLFLVLGALILASVTSCKKDPQTEALKNKKISTISYSEDAMTRIPLANFNWNDKNLLKSIELMEYSGAVELVVNFAYENNLVNSIDCFQYSINLALNYQDKKLDQLTLCFTGDTIATGDVTFDDDKVSMLTVTIYDEEKLLQCSPFLNALAITVPQELQKPFAQFMHQVVANHQSKEEYKVNAQFTWDGDNVSKIYASGLGYSITANLNYDSKTNPLYGFMSLFGCSFPKNNPTQATAIIGYEKVNAVVNYQYDDDEYPLQMSAYLYDPANPTESHEQTPIFFIDYQ